MKLRRVRITENSEQDTAEFVILPGLREQARRGGIRRLTALESDRRKIEETYLKAVDIGYSYRLAKKMEEFKSNPVLGYRTAGSKAEFDTGEFLKEEIKEFVDGHYGMPDTERLFPVVQEAVQHKMKRQIELAGVKKIRVHDLRHSHVAYLIEKGMDASRMCQIMKQAMEERRDGVQVLVSQMNKNKKFQKEQLNKEGYTDFVEFYREALK